MMIFLGWLLGLVLGFLLAFSLISLTEDREGEDWFYHILGKWRR